MELKKRGQMTLLSSDDKYTPRSNDCRRFEWLWIEGVGWIDRDCWWLLCRDCRSREACGDVKQVAYLSGYRWKSGYQKYTREESIR